MADEVISVLSFHRRNIRHRLGLCGRQCGWGQDNGGRRIGDGAVWRDWGRQHRLHTIHAGNGHLDSYRVVNVILRVNVK